MNRNLLAITLHLNQTLFKTSGNIKIYSKLINGNFLKERNKEVKELDLYFLNFESSK